MSLVESIAAILAEKFPFTIFLDKVPEGFERPSFYVYEISSQVYSNNRYTYTENTIVQVIYFSPIDDYENIISKIDQTNVINAIKYKLMSSMAVSHTDGLWAKVNKLNSDYTDDKDIFLQINLSTTVSTRRFNEGTPVPPMQEINIKGGVK